MSNQDTTPTDGYRPTATRPIDAPALIARLKTMRDPHIVFLGRFLANRDLAIDGIDDLVYTVLAQCLPIPKTAAAVRVATEAVDRLQIEDNATLQRLSRAVAYVVANRDKLGDLANIAESPAWPYQRLIREIELGAFDVPEPVPGHWEWVGETWESKDRDAVMAAITGRRPEEIQPFMIRRDRISSGQEYFIEYLGCEKTGPPDPDEWALRMRKWDDYNHDCSPVVADWILDGPIPAAIVQRRVRKLRASYIENLRRVVETGR